MKCHTADIILKINDYLEISDVVLFDYMKKKASSITLIRKVLNPPKVVLNYLIKLEVLNWCCNY